MTVKYLSLECLSKKETQSMENKQTKIIQHTLLFFFIRQEQNKCLWL